MWRYVAWALLLNPLKAFAWIPGIEEHLQPPRHEALENFEFLAVLRVDKDHGARRGARHTEHGQREQGQPRHWSHWGRTLLKPFAALHQISSPLSAVTVDWSWPQAMDSQFEDSEQLAGGSFGVVFLAKDKKTNQQVAVKLLKTRTMTLFGQGESSP
eukprot:s2614_g15.t1